MDGVDQMTYETGVRGPLEAFYETLTPNVSNILKLADEKLIIQRGRIVQNNYNERQIQELSIAISDARSKARTEAYDLLIEGQNIKPAIDLYIDKVNATSGSDRYLSGEIKKETKVLNDMQKLYSIIGPHIVKHGEEESLDKLVNTSIIANGYLKGQRSVSLSDGTRLDISQLKDISGDAIQSVANRLELVAGSNNKYQEQISNRNVIKKLIEVNGINKFVSRSGKKPEQISKMIQDDPKLLSEIYETFLQHIPNETQIPPNRNNPFQDERFRKVMLDQGVIFETDRLNIINALETNDPELIRDVMPVIINIKDAKTQASHMGFTEEHEDKIHMLAKAMSANIDSAINTRRILEFTQGVTNAKEMGIDATMEEYKRQIKHRFGSLAGFYEEIGHRFDDYIRNQEDKNGLDDVYYGEVVMSRVMEAISRKVNMGAKIDDDLIEQQIDIEVKNMLGSGKYAFSRRGVSFRRLGNPEDDFNIRDVMPQNILVPDFIYDDDAINRKGTFMFNAPEAIYGIDNSVEYLVPFATQLVKNYFKELEKVSEVKMPENIEDQIRFIPNEGITGTDFLIILMTPSGEEQTLSGTDGMLKLEHNLIEKIRSDLAAKEIKGDLDG